jgi:hypothetical protein
MADWTTHRCRKCKGLYVHVRAARSRLIFKMDAEPTPNGNLMVVNEEYQLPQVIGLAPGVREAEQQFTSHVYSCPLRVRDQES